MFKSLALTAIALATVLAFGNTAAQAGGVQEKTGKVITDPTIGQQKYLWCIKPPLKAYVQCTKAEYARFVAETKRQNAEKKKQAAAARMDKEMAAEQRAYQKMQQERKERATTTEHCYMVNGQLQCKPAP